MSAVLPTNHSPATPPTASLGVWGAAWKRFRSDRVGMVSLGIVAAFLVLVIAAAVGLVARGWQAEVAVPNAPPTFVGPRAATESTAIPVPKGPNVDISDIDPLAPKYQEWAEATTKYKTVDTVK
ncbi:MAG: ABC transporter permease, partial [Ideonella sp.]|nr:ABC transporter permease [Ideonella sp.]